MIRLRRENAWTYTVDGDDSILVWLLTVDKPFRVRRDVETSPGTFESVLMVEVGKQCLYNRRHKRLPSGLCNYLTDLAKRNDIQIEIDDQRIRPQSPDQPDSGGVLDVIGTRSYQVRMFHEMMDRGQGVYQAATGAGKTEVAAALLYKLWLPTLYLVPNLTLLNSTAERLRRYLGDDCVGTIGGGKCNIAQFTVATVQTAYSRFKALQTRLFKRVDVLIADEAHHVRSRTFHRVMMACDAYYRIALSGTPMREDQRSNMLLVGATGDLIGRIGYKELITDDYLAKPYVIMFRYRPDPVPWEFDDYGKIYEAAIVRSDSRNRCVMEAARLLLTQDLRSLVIVRRVAHGHALQRLFNNHGINTEFISGQSSAYMRDAVIRLMEKGRMHCLIATTIFDEGVDIPNLPAVILACGERSPIAIVQRIGRGLRPKSGDNMLTVVDFIDVCHPFVGKHTKERKGLYESHDFPVYEADAHGSLNEIKQDARTWWSNIT